MSDLITVKRYFSRQQATGYSYIIIKHNMVLRTMVNWTSVTKDQVWCSARHKLEYPARAVFSEGDRHMFSLITSCVYDNPCFARRT
jgi:hypothetical protein